MLSRRAYRRSQGMTEYLIIAGVIAILLIVIFKSYGRLLGVTVEGGNTEINTISSDIQSSGTDGAGGNPATTTGGTGDDDDAPLLPQRPDNGG